MKKIKYLLSLLILSIGLLISRSFAFVVEGVTLPITSSDFSQSANYKYQFQYTQTITNGTATPYARMFGYILSYDGQTQFNYRPVYKYANQTNNGCPSEYNDVLLNSGVFYSSLYTGFCYRGGGNAQLQMFVNMPNLPWNTAFDSRYRFLMGNGTEFGKNFVYVGSVEDPFPKYSLGGGFFFSNNWVELDSTVIDWSPLRIFFNQNLNLSSPLDGFNIGANSGSNITGSIARQYFTNRGFRYQTKNQNSPKTFGDLGGSYNKGIHFGGYGVGYSFAINKSNGTGISWSDLNFVSVGSKCLKSLMDLGINDPNSGTSSGCQQVGLLVLKGDTYVSRNNNAGVVIIGKDITNSQRLLYEEFDCAEDDISSLMYGDSCSSLSHGYLKYDNSDLILPFVDSNNSLNYQNWGILKFFISGLNYGYTSINNSHQFCLNGGNGGSTYCFTLNPDPDSKSLKEYYLEGSLGLNSSTVSDTINQQVISACLNNDTFALLNSAFCKIINATYGNIVAVGTGQYMQTTFNESGQLVFQIIDQAGLFNGDYGLIWIQDLNGNWVANCSGGWCDTNPYDNIAGSIYLTGYSDFYASGLSLSYYDSNTGLFFKCPYPVEKVFNFFGWDGELFGFDFALPVNCFFSAFNYGKSFQFLKLNDLYNFGPLINGDTQMHKILFRFLDMVVILGLTVLLSAIFKFFK